MTPTIIKLPSWWYYTTCLAIALLLSIAPSVPSPNLLGAELFLIVLALFIFSSSRYRINANTITYGALPILFATFFQIVPRNSILHWETIKQTLFSLNALEKLIHLDTMLFIIGLTFFVSAIAQSRLLEEISLQLLERQKGNLFLTSLVIAGLVSILSGILDGVSMVGLLIRVWVILLVMAKLEAKKIESMILVSVVITTVCGMWLAYGEPPNLIMKSNLGLSDLFFLTYAAPLAIAAFVVVVIFIYQITRSKVVPLSELDVLERHLADIRFFQAKYQGAIWETDDIIDHFKERLGEKKVAVEAFYHQGHHPISALTLAQVDTALIRDCIRDYLSAEFVEPVLAYYEHRHHNKEGAATAANQIVALFAKTSAERKRVQWWGKLAFLPFIGLLMAHAHSDYPVPLFVAPWAAFFVAFLGIISYRKMTKLSLHEAAVESKGYLFLFPLFLAITMLSAVGFFDPIRTAILQGVTIWGHGHLAVIQFFAAGVFSALLDNNVVADFLSRAIIGLPDMFLFAAAQIAGYAVGGSLTHIGSAQSVIAFSFIIRYLNPNFTPFDWIRGIWRLILILSVVMTGVIYLMAIFL